MPTILSKSSSAITSPIGPKLSIKPFDESTIRIDRQEGVTTTHKGLYLEMLNPSTGESHFEGVANVGDWDGLRKATVKEALKWRDGDSHIRNGRMGHSRDDEAYITPIVLT